MIPTIDVIGFMYSGGTYDAEGNELTPSIQLEGWHVNTIPEVPEWASCRVIPASKRRIFAGMEAETCCYVFPSEESYLTELEKL